MANRRRAHKITTRMTEDEFLVYLENRDKSGLGTTAFVNDMLIHGEVKQRMPAAYGDLVKEVNRIGVNINQIARVANASQYVNVNDLRECISLLQEIKTIVVDMAK